MHVIDDVSKILRKGRLPGAAGGDVGGVAQDAAEDVDGDGFGFAVLEVVAVGEGEEGLTDLG